MFPLNRPLHHQGAQLTNSIAINRQANVRKAVYHVATYAAELIDELLSTHKVREQHARTSDEPLTMWRCTDREKEEADVLPRVALSLVVSE
jgi:hypothetical protein